MVTFESGQYSVPHTLLGATVWVRTQGVGVDEQVVIVHVGDDGPLEVARHHRATPGSPRIVDAHFPHQPPGPLERRPRAKKPAEAEFLDLGEGARLWLIEAAAAGTPRIRVKMAEALALAKLFDPVEVDWALGHAAVHGRFAEADLSSILDHHATRPAAGEHRCRRGPLADSRHRSVGTTRGVAQRRGGHRVKTPDAPPLPAELESCCAGCGCPTSVATPPRSSRPRRRNAGNPPSPQGPVRRGGRRPGTLRTRHQTGAAGFPTGKTFDAWQPEISSIPAPTQQALRTLEWVPPTGEPRPMRTVRQREDVPPGGPRPASRRSRVEGRLVHPGGPRGAATPPPRRRHRSQGHRPDPARRPGHR
jgi:hypothetical protein